MLYLVATPIGNAQDITLRALETLKNVEMILAEDTRKTGRLLKSFGIKKPLLSFYEYNERKRIPRIIASLKEGRDIALVSSAGIPTLSDPGYLLVKTCREQAIAFTCLPGPSSLTTALAISGIPREKFVFLGYLPRKEKERRRLLSRVDQLGFPLVFFESPYRLKATLEAVFNRCGNRMITVAREMTKKFEEVKEMTVQDALVLYGKKLPRGEFTLILDRKRP
jgi:16S rRNA (cytidine1402-2'-O)-methyltransferase